VSVVHGIIKTSVHDIMRQVDDVLDYRNVTRAEALKFLQEMLIEVEVRIGWVREDWQR
jgi:hypothetical protein